MGEMAVTVGGERWLQIVLESQKQGVMVTVKAHPLIESFFLERSKGTTTPELISGAAGKYWMPVNSKMLEIYDIEDLTLENDGRYSLVLPGYPLMYDGNTINLSFLRIKGISEGVFDPEGISTCVRFLVKEPMNLPRMREIRDSIGKALRIFCRDYIIHTKLILEVTSRET